MNKEEKQLEAFVNTIRFDDEPNTAHRDKLEAELLQAYEYEQKYGDYVEPVSVYFRRFAVAAGFLIVCGVLFWAIDSAVISPEEQFLAGHPDKEEIEQILVEEKAVTAIEKKNLLAQFSQVWDMVSDQDSESLVSVLQTSDMSYKVRTWGATYLGKFGSKETLASLEEAIGQLKITDPNDPLKIAATKIRKRLNLPEPKSEPQAVESSESELPSMRALD